MNQDRRGVMALAVGMVAATASRSPAKAAATGAMPVIVNTLGGLSDYNAPPTSNRKPNFLQLSPRVVVDARASGVTAMNVTIGYVAGPADPFEATVDDLAAVGQTIRANPDLFRLVLRADDIVQSKRDGRIGVICGVQNCAMLGDKVARVDTFCDLGLRIFQLTYNEENRLGGGSRAETVGLTPFGREVIAAVNARRAIVDLSHGGYRTAMDAVTVSRQPACISHTGCRALKDTPRNAPDDLLRAVATRGGYVGIMFGGMFLAASGRSTIDDVLAHIDHAITICGEDAVGIGTDNPVTGIDDLPDWTRMWEEAARGRAKAGVGASGETSGLPFTADLLGPDQFRKLIAGMRGRGYSRARIDKVMGMNFVGYARRVWGG